MRDKKIFVARVMAVLFFGYLLAALKYRSNFVLFTGSLLAAIILHTGIILALHLEKK